MKKEKLFCRTSPIQPVITDSGGTVTDIEKSRYPHPSADKRGAIGWDEKNSTQRAEKP